MCKDLKLIIEVDGYSHGNERQFFRDQIRQKELEKHGYTILRFSEKEVMQDLRNVESVIVGWIESRGRKKMP